MNIEVTIQGLDKLENLIKQKDIEEKIQEFVYRLGMQGMLCAEINYSAAHYDGDKDVQVSFDLIGNNEGEIVASGNTVLFIEYGTGVMGVGHPEAEEKGYGAGTYSDTIGKGLWNNPQGWFYRDTKGYLHRSWGNVPSMAMYNASKEMIRQAQEIAEEVFKW